MSESRLADAGPLSGRSCVSSRAAGRKQPQPKRIITRLRADNGHLSGVAEGGLGDNGKTIIAAAREGRNSSCRKSPGSRRAEGRAPAY